MSNSSDVPALPPLPEIDIGSPIATNADTEPYMDDEGKPWVAVVVGELAGYYSVHLHKVVASDGRIYTPTGFECAGGKENNRKWRLSLRVLLPNGQRGRTLGHWLTGRGLDHLIPQLTPRRVPTGSRSGSGSGGRPDTSSAPSSARTSPDKRPRAPEIASPDDASPTKLLRKAFGAATLGVGHAAGPPLPMPRPAAPDSPPAADVIGAFMEQPLAAAAASRRGLVTTGPPAGGEHTPTVFPGLGAASNQVTPTLFPPGVAPHQLTPAEALALEELDRGMTVTLHPPVTAGGASGLPVFPSRVIGGGGGGDNAMVTPPAPHEETGLGAPRARPRQPTPIPSAADVTAALAHSHCTYGIAAPGAGVASPAHSTGVRLPPRQDSGSSLDLARVFDYEDGQLSPGGGTGAAAMMAALGVVVSPALGSSPRRGGGGGRGGERTGTSPDWNADASITLAAGGPLDLPGAAAAGGGLAGVLGAGQNPKHSDGSSLSNGRSAMMPLKHEEAGLLFPSGDPAPAARGVGMTDKATAAALGLPLVAPAPAPKVLDSNEEAAKAASIGSSSMGDKDAGGPSAGAPRLEPH